jgi:aspartyl/asparaginyl-tRNA synthetase
MQVNDGSTVSGIQVVIQPEALGFDLIASGAINTGAAVAVQGQLVESPGGKQKVRFGITMLMPWVGLRSVH